MIYGYLRVSTSVQTAENQKLQIKKYCKENHLHNIKWYSETVSGTVSPDKRKLGELLKIAQEGDLIICTELSRLGRSLVMIMNELDLCLQKKVQVVAIKEHFILDDSIACKALMFAFGLSAEIERQFLEEKEKAFKAEALKTSPKPGQGGTGTPPTKTVTKEQFNKMTTQEQIAYKTEHPDDWSKFTS